MSLIAAVLHKSLTHNACPAALRFEEAFIEFIESGEQRMVIDESLTGFGVRLLSFHACLKFCQDVVALQHCDLVTRPLSRRNVLFITSRIPSAKLAQIYTIIVQYKEHCTFQ